jgi:thymidine phosphorylase
MPTLAQSRALAESLVAVANGAGLRTSALITDMNEPLASAAGNALEMRNAVDFLTGRHRDQRLLEEKLALCAAALSSVGIVDAREKAEAALASGAALERFAKMVAELGGPADFVARMDNYLQPAPIIRDIRAPREGTVTAIDTKAVGMAVVALGGGRTRPTDPIDHAVGFSALAGLGAEVTPQSPLCTVHARNDDAAKAAEARILAAYTIGDAAPAHELIAARIDPKGAA